MPLKEIPYGVMALKLKLRIFVINFRRKACSKCSVFTENTMSVMMMKPRTTCEVVAKLHIYKLFYFIRL